LFDFVDDAEEEVYIPLPESLTSLRRELLGDYKCPPNPPSLGHRLHKLTKCQELSIKHYTAWKDSNGTVNKAFNFHAPILKEATGQEILSLYGCQQLAIKLTELEAQKVDVCPNSCIAYTGQFKVLTACPYV
jgi:hypothetical protein